MAQMLQTSPDYRHRLDAAVTALSFYIRDLCPEAQIEVSFTRYEDEDAHIWVSLPLTLSTEEHEDVANQIAEKSIDMLLAEGFLILVGLEESDSK
jgi:hypothetical protein